MRDCHSPGAKRAVVLVHPSRLYTEGLASLLKDTDYDRVHQLNNVDDGVCLPLDELDGKIIFVVGGRTCYEIVSIVKNIRAELNSAYILVVNTPADPNDVMAALEAGADGYLRDAISSRTFVRVIELVIEDEAILPPEFVKSLTEMRDSSRDEVSGADQSHEESSEAASGRNGAGVKLSAREGSILRGLVDGAPNKVIAQRLHITEATVKVHVKAILRKIRVKNRTQAAIWASRNLETTEPEPDPDRVPALKLLEHSAGKKTEAQARP